MTDTNATLAYGDNTALTVTIASLPAVSIEALLKRGFSHLLGNEQASKVASHFDGKTPTDEEKAAFKLECQIAAIAALVAGTVGTRSGVVRGTARDTVIRDLARKEVTSVLKANKIAFPTGDKKVKMPDGSELGGAELVARYVAKHGERLGKEADAEMKRRDKQGAAAGSLADAF